MNKKSQTILITGASSGLGRETALRLAKEGFNVFAGVRKKIDKEELEKLNKNIKGVYLDVTNAGSIEKAFWYVIKNTDKIDVLINNAGIAAASPVECINIKNLKEQFEVNTFGAISVVQKFMPLLAGSKIINISSMASYGIFPYISPYCASKRALDILFNAFELENKDNIKVISIKPGCVKTPIWNKSVNRAKKFFEAVKEAEKRKYEKEFSALQLRALENNKKALETFYVVEAILKVIRTKNPKPSYNVGIQAIFAELISKLPLGIVNKFIKAGFKNIIH